MPSRKKRFTVDFAPIETALLGNTASWMADRYNELAETAWKRPPAKARAAELLARMLVETAGRRRALVDLDAIARKSEVLLTEAHPAPAEPRDARRGAPTKAQKYNVSGSGRKLLPREGSARRVAYDLLVRPQGATEAQVAEATGWNERNTYAGIRLIALANGYDLTQDEKGRIRITG